MQQPPAIAAPPAIPSPEELRRSHLNHEVSVRSIGLLYYLAATMCAAGLLAMAVPDEETSASVRIVLAALMLVLLPIYLWLGRGLRKLDPKVKIGVTILSAFGLLSFPIGTLINGYILYLLHSAKGKMVFSPEYQQAVAATPHIQYKTSPIVIGLLVLLGLLVSLGVVAMLFGRN